VKLFRSLLGRDDLEARVSELEKRMDEHTVALRAIADALRLQSNALVSISTELKSLIKGFGIEETNSSNFGMKIKSDDTYH